MSGSVATDAARCHTKLRLEFSSNRARNRHRHRASHRSGHLGQSQTFLLQAAATRNTSLAPRLGDYAFHLLLG
jgi:hypothetical protein